MEGQCDWLWEPWEPWTHGSRRKPGEFDFCSWTLLSQKHRYGRKMALSLGRTFSSLPPRGWKLLSFLR